ncbi:MAG TPA: cytochrome P450 [Phenylobacterium sp.]|nr:cytochrome P450 [Phenylobacterium sp.]
MADIAPGEQPVTLSQIQTPAVAGGLLSGPTALGIAAWIGVRVLNKPLRFGSTVIAARHRHVDEVLRRDLDFRIAPINAARIEAVNGPFMLGMDRSDALTEEHRVLHAAMSEVDLGALVARATADAEALIAAAGYGPIDAVAGYARVVAGRTARRFFGIAGPDEATFREVARAIFAHTFLNLGGDKAVEQRALKAASLMRAWLETEIASRRRDGVTGEDLMGALMRQTSLDDDGVRRILGGMLVGSVDTTTSCVAKILVVMSRDRGLLDRARHDAGDGSRMLGWCREALRRWPHNPLVLRQAETDTTLGGVAVPAGSRVFAWTQAAMQDAEAFPDPETLRPDRPADGYLHFGGGLHPCAGRGLSDMQIPMLVSRLLERGVGKVGPMRWAGPFPDHLPVDLDRGR